MAEICMHQTLCFLRCINEKFTGNDFLIFFSKGKETFRQERVKYNLSAGFDSWCN